MSLVFFLLSFAIVLLADGGVYPSSLAVAVVFMALSMAITGLTQGIHRETAPIFLGVLAIWLVLIGWTVIQTLPLPFGIFANPAWRGLQEAGLTVPGRIAVVPADAIAALPPISLPFMTLLSALMLFRNDREVEWALSVFAICGAAFALFAIVQSTLFPGMLMFSAKQSYFGSLTAPFVNRNTAATFYGLIVIALLVCFALAKSEADRRRGRRSERQSGVPPWAYLLMALVAVVALSLTRSRGGIAASVLGGGMLLVTLILHFAAQKAPLSRTGAAGRPAWGRRALAAVATVGLIAVVSSMLFGGTILRAEIQGSEDGRFCVYPGIWEAIKDNFPVGIGPGGFGFYFPAYRDPVCGLEGVWMKAHNVYLESLLSFGVPVSVAVVAATSLILWVVFTTGIKRRKSKKPVVLGGIAAILLVLAHSIVDFSLQIPGFAMSFSLFLGLSATISFTSTRRRSLSNKLTT